MVLSRAAQAVPVLLVVAVVVFTIIHLVPGDPARALLGAEASETDVQALRQTLGLNDPLWAQFLSWIGSVITGDLGYSFFLQQPVGEAIIQHAGPTAWLAFVAMLIAVAIGVPAGVLAARRPGGHLDRLLLGGSVLSISTPSFLIGLLLVMVFGLWLRWLPVAGYISPFDDFGGSLRAILLPAFALALVYASLIMRMTRASMVDLLGQNYIETARSKGVDEGRVLVQHALRNAAAPIITVVGQALGALITGALVVELVFGIPGVGQLIGNSIGRRDYAVIQGVVLVCAAIYVLINLIVDVAYELLDPRMRRSR